MFYEPKHKAIFDAIPTAMFVVDKNLKIVDANNKFKSWFPKYTENEINICYKTILPYDKDGPCSNCLIKRTFQTGKEASRIVKSIRDGQRVYYKIVTSPVASGTSKIETVIESIEDITTRIIAEKKVETFNMQLEQENTQNLCSLHDKEEKLTALINTVHEIKSAGSIEESVEKLINGFIGLDAAAVAFVLFDENSMSLSKFYPQESINKLNDIFKIDLYNNNNFSAKYPENPFVFATELGKPTFHVGEEGILNFFKSCFPKRKDREIEKAASLFNGLSMSIFPLKIKYNAQGAIAVFTELDTLQSNFEFYSMLSNSASVEISRQMNSNKLINSELKYRNLVETSRDMILLCDNDGNIEFSNSTFYDKTGLSKDKARFLNLYDLIDPEERKILGETVRACLNGNKNPELLELSMKIPAREDLWIEISLNRSSEGKSGFQVIARDITPRKKMVIELDKLAAFNEKIVQNDYLGIITTDLNGSILSWNRGAEGILGYSEIEVFGKNVDDLIIRDIERDLNLFNSKKTDPAQQINNEIRMKSKTGTPVMVKYIESRMKDNSGKPIATIAFFFDLTEQEKYETMSRELTQQLSHAQLITILSLAKLTEYRDIETGHHLERIMKYTEHLAKGLSKLDYLQDYVTERYINDLVNSCLLHDIGKVGIPDSVLQKPGKLSHDEFEVMKTHTIIGGNSIMEAEKKVEGLSYLNIGKEVAYYHHEKWDGTGYPLGLKGIEIPLSARIVAVADVYDALTSKRPYKDAYSHEYAASIIAETAGTHFDHDVVNTFLSCEKDFIHWKQAYS